MATEQFVLAVMRLSKPRFRKPADKVAFAVHSSFIASDYVLLSTGLSPFPEDGLPSNIEEEIDNTWNDDDGEYVFVYSNPNRNSRKVIVWCFIVSATFDYLFVEAAGEGQSETFILSLKVRDYDNGNGNANEATTNYGLQYKNLGKLVSIVEKEILSKLNGTSTGSEIQPSRSRSRNVGVNQLNCPHLPYCPYCAPGFYRPCGLPGAGAGMYPTWVTHSYHYVEVYVPQAFHGLLLNSYTRNQWRQRR